MPERNEPHCFFHGVGGCEYLPVVLDGVGVIADFMRPDYCAIVHENAHVAHRAEPHGIPITWYDVWAKRRHEQHRFKARLVCSHQDHEVHAGTTGPGHHGASLPCPHGSRPLQGGAIWGRIDEREPPLGMSQTHGSFGHHHDGFWHYKFHNSEHHNTPARLAGVCA